jgi:hypothetical protein
MHTVTGISLEYGTKNMLIYKIIAYPVQDLSVY